VGEYTAGWIKRGPTGVIGTNKPDALETVTAMLEDAAGGRALAPAESERAAAERLLRQRQPRVIEYADWLRLNALEVERGRAQARPRLKFTRVDEMLTALGNRT
jgi:ferredoxin/flavodoxin---NADP+ reductase